MQGNVTILVTWANAMQASWCYRCAEDLCWWLWVQGNGCSRPAVAIGVLVVLCWFYRCNLPAVAIDVLRLCAGALWVQHGNGCRPAGSIGVLRLCAGVFPFVIVVLLLFC